MSLEGLTDQEIADMEQRLLQLVGEWGGSGGNISLIRDLEWEEEQYWSLRDRLVDAGQLILGRGRGGSVRIPGLEDETAKEEPGEEEANAAPKEADLYDPLYDLIRNRWVKDQRFERSIVEITARQGRRDTGGTWTRPDIVVVSLTTFLYVPGKHFEVVTFEIKPWATLDVTGVYEALAHQRASTRAFLLAHIPEEELQTEYTQRYIQRIDEEAKRHGVGFVVVSDPTDYGTWDERVEAQYRDPPPHIVNEFLSLQLSEGAKGEMLTWFR